MLQVKATQSTGGSPRADYEFLGGELIWWRWAPPAERRLGCHRGQTRLDIGQRSSLSTTDYWEFEWCSLNVSEVASPVRVRFDSSTQSGLLLVCLTGKNAAGTSSCVISACSARS